MGGERQQTAAASGTLWLCPEGLAEDSISITGELPDILHVYLPRTVFADLGREDGYPDLSPESLQYKAGFSDPLVQQLAMAIASEMESPSIGGKVFVESAALTLAARLAQSHATLHRSPADPTSAVHGLDKSRLRRVVDFIEAHLEANLSINDLADIACLSPFHFSRAFKLATGQPPYRYLARKRIEHAKALLSGSDIPIAEVSRRCQFVTQAGFAKAFTAIVGCSPRRFRSWGRRRS